MATITLGDWTVHTLETGALWLDGGAMFGSVPRPLWSRLNPPDERNRIRLAMRCLLLEGHGRRVLVDVGLGEKPDARFRDIFRVEPSPTLEDSLAAIGRDPADITDVMLTHLHFDHAGGATVRMAEGGLRPRLPAAAWHVPLRNWDNAHAANVRERASYLPENYDPLREHGVLDFLPDRAEPWPGVRTITADGHTLGQQIVRIEGGGRVLYFVADLIPTASHVRIPYVMGYDMCAERTMREKRDLLAGACREGAWIVLEHDPDTALARPEAAGEDFGWAARVPASEAGALDL